MVCWSIKGSQNDGLPCEVCLEHLYAETMLAFARFEREKRIMNEVGKEMRAGRRENDTEGRHDVSANVSSSNISCSLLQTGTAEGSDVDANSFVLSGILLIVVVNGCI